MVKTLFFHRRLSKAKKSGDFDRAKEMIKSGADVNNYKPEVFVTFSRKWMLFFIKHGYKLDRPKECILRIFFWVNDKPRDDDKNWDNQQDYIFERLKALLRAGADPKCQNRKDEPLLVEISGENSTSEARANQYKHKSYVNAYKLILRNSRSQIKEWFVETKYNFRGKTGIANIKVFNIKPYIF
jgi:hypothetical protein